MKIQFAMLLTVLTTNACVVVSAEELLKTENKSFDASGVTSARLDTGAGTLRIIGDADATSIEVKAEYRGRPRSSRDAERILDNLRLTMEMQGSTFYLRSESGGHWRGSRSGSIDLTITVPSRFSLKIEDGSGSIDLSGIDRDVTIDDGSGSIDIDAVRGNLRLDDGSGSIQIRDSGGRIEIKDGSGSIDISRAGGDVTIRDGSGSISVDDVAGGFEVLRDSSGSINHRGVRGEVRIPRNKRKNR